MKFLNKLDKPMSDQLHQDKAFARSLFEIQLSAVLQNAYPTS